MKLETAESSSVDHATEQHLRDAFKEDANRGEFIILSQKPEVYIQAGGEDEPFTLEYRDGDAEHHYRAENASRKEDVERAFVWYLAGDSRWRTDFVWKKLKAKPWWRFW